MPRKKKEKLIDAKPIGQEHRADRIRYWLEQRDYPSNFNSPEFKSKSTVFDRMILGMISKAGEGNAAAANWIMDNAFGKNTEGADTSLVGENAGATFNIAGNVAELYAAQEEKRKLDEQNDSLSDKIQSEDTSE